MTKSPRLPRVYSLASKSDLPYTLAGNPRLDTWIQFLPGDRVEIRSGKVELGQGIATAIAQIAADELDLDLSRIAMLPTDTSVSPDEGSTTGSRSIQEGGMAMRQACARIRAIFLASASRQMGVDIVSLSVEDGVIRSASSNETLSYWELAASVDLTVSAEDVTATPKQIAALTRVGQSVPRTDLTPKLSHGGFIQDIDLPGMLHGRVVRPPSFRATLLSIDSAAVAASPGIRAVVHNGNFIGVVAEREEQAIVAMQALRESCQWSEIDDLPDMADLKHFLRHADADVEVLRGDEGPSRAAEHSVEAAYSRPFIAHASLAPSCALAWWREDRLDIWSHSQAIFALRDEIADVLEMQHDKVTLRHAPGAGCYGHNGSDDAALDAALLAEAVKGSPVRLQWMRDDEFGWEPFGPAMLVEIKGGVQASGDVAVWDQHIWGNRHIARPGRLESPALLAAWHMDKGYAEPAAVDMPLSMGGGGQRNAVPYYDFTGVSVVNDALNEMPLRTSALRALGAHLNIFAIESFMDELATAAGLDPVEFRLRQLQDQRSRAVIEAVADMSGWGTPPAGEGRGKGIAFARYKNVSTFAAVVAEVEVAETVKVLKVHAAVDCGRLINPDGALNQCEGGIVQAVSWTLKEQVTFDRRTITSRGWDTYPILRFSEVPEVEVKLIDRPDEEPLGVGEGMTGPTSAAIGNAIFNAMGLRVRDLPFTSENITRAME